MDANAKTADPQTLDAPSREPARRPLRGLDAVRAAAVVAVVALHSGMPYLTHPMPGLAWSVRDAASPTVDFAFWSIELIVMPLFLIIAGFLAAETLTRRGPMGLVKNRGKRLLIPLVFGMVVVLPLDLYAWVLGWVTEGLVSPVKLKSLKFDGVIDRDLWGLGHLWFLQYLFQYIVVLAVATVTLDRYPRLRWSHVSPRSVAIAIIALAIAVLCVRPQVVWGFQHAFAPVPSKWLYHAAFFFAGVGVAVFDPTWTRTRTMATRWAGPAIAMGIATVLLGQWHLSQSNKLAGNDLVGNDLVGNKLAGNDLAGDALQAAGFANLTLAAMTATAAMLIATFGIALAVGHVRRLPRSVEYLAAASFWIYLVHHPVLGLVHIDLKYLLPGVPAAVKAVASGLIALTVSLLTYEGFVRRTMLGRWLGMTFEFASLGDTMIPVSDGAVPNDADGPDHPATISIDTGIDSGSPTIPADARPRRAA